MKINFGKYTYVDNTRLLNSPIAPQYRNEYSNEAFANEYPEYSSKVKYDSKYFNDLIDERKYLEAADYADKFKMNDPEQQRIRDNEIINLRREGRKMNAIFSRVASNEDKQAIEFYMNVFKNKGIDKISSNNIFNKDFIELKNNLGGSNATTLEITFAPEKQYLFGDWFDFLMPDNKANIDDFYSRSGLTKEELENAGVDITPKDGNIIMRFDKSNMYANYILYNLRDGRSTSRPEDSNNPYFNSIRGYDDKGNQTDGGNVGTARKLKDLIDRTREVSEKYGQPFNYTDVYSATVGTFIEDGLEEIRKRYADGDLKVSEYKALMDERYGDITSVLKSLGSANYVIYSDSYNKQATDETMVPLANQERSWAINEITAAENYSLNSMIVNGQIGTLVTIYSTPEEKKNIDDKSTPEEMVKNKRHSFFIPGLFHDKAQAAINKDTNTRAEQELNEMRKWNYPIELAGGGSLKPVGGNIFKYNGKDISKEQALTYVKKDLIIEDAKRNLKYQFMSVTGEINIPMYQDLTKKLAYTSVEELFPNINLTFINGEPITLDDMFAMKGIGSNVATEYQKYMTRDVYEKLCQAYSIYDILMMDVNNN